MNRRDVGMMEAFRVSKEVLVDDSFTLYNLEVSVVGDPESFVCAHVPGLAFTVQGEDLVFTSPNNQFSMYALATLLPLLPAKQRMTHKADWMTSDALIACPDPHCRAQFKITRTDTKTFRHSETTRVPMPNDKET